MVLSISLFPYAEMSQIFSAPVPNGILSTCSECHRRPLSRMPFATHGRNAISQDAANNKNKSEIPRIQQVLSLKNKLCKKTHVVKCLPLKYVTGSNLVDGVHDHQARHNPRGVYVYCCPANKSDCERCNNRHNFVCTELMTIANSAACRNAFYDTNSELNYCCTSSYPHDEQLEQISCDETLGLRDTLVDHKIIGKNMFSVTAHDYNFNNVHSSVTSEPRAMNNMKRISDDKLKKYLQDGMSGLQCSMKYKLYESSSCATKSSNSAKYGKQRAGNRCGGDILNCRKCDINCEDGHAPRLHPTDEICYLGCCCCALHAGECDLREDICSYSAAIK